MRTPLFALVLAAGAVSGALPAWAALDPPPAAQEPSGDWRLSEVGGKIACTLTFTHQAGAGGFEVKAPLACRRAFPPLQTVAAWTLDKAGEIVLADAQAKPIVVFPAESDGAYQGKAPDGRTWRLEPLPPKPAAA